MEKRNVKLIVAATGLVCFATGAVASNHFSDLAGVDWAMDSIKWASEQGLIMGTDGMYRPGDNVNRAELAVIMHRYDEHITSKMDEYHYGGEMMDEDEDMEYEAMPATVVDIALGDAEFSTLVTALVAADLVDALMGEGYFTVFAPDNAAFDMLDSDELSELLKPENKDLLVELLSYHVVPGHFMFDDLEDGQLLTTLTGEELYVSIDEEGYVYVDGVLIMEADTMADNGVVHTVEEVVFPAQG